LNRYWDSIWISRKKNNCECKRYYGKLPIFNVLFLVLIILNIIGYDIIAIIKCRK